MTEPDLFHLRTPQASLIVERGKDGSVSWRYFGPPVDARHAPFSGTVRGRTTFSVENDAPAPVVPTSGAGWFGPNAIALRDESGMPVHLAWSEARVEQDSDRLAIHLSDLVAGISCRLFAKTVDGGAILMSTSATNEGDTPVTVARLASAVMPLPHGLAHILSWRGRHNVEGVPCKEPFPEHRWVRETRGGIPGHGGPPGVYCLGASAGFDEGPVFAAQLAWSGDTRLAIERHDDGFWALSAEAVLQEGELVLAPGASHATPEFVIALSQDGRNAAMAQQHAAIRGRLVWPGARMHPRPVHLNSWEACYFDHDEHRIRTLAQEAAELGAERFVLDDGWFVGRDNDRAGLGDWIADPRKYPAGLAPLARAVTELGMEFGLWVEPEMVNPDSDLYRAHRDWVLAEPDRERPTARNQLVLDMQRADVRDHLFDRLDALLREVPVAYLKWDHNRALAPPGGAAQVHGTYRLLERLREAHPDVEIESCAAGGGRVDAGIAAYVHRFWPSDNLDAVERVRIQRSFLAFMPPEVMGAHVGASPSHATGRDQAMDFRAAIACQGHLGVELDPAKLAPAERDTLRDWIAFWKEWRAVILGGRTMLGEAPDGLLWQAQGDGTRWLVWLIRTAPQTQARAPEIPLPFAKGGTWNVSLLRMIGAAPQPEHAISPFFEEIGKCPARFDGEWLARVGLPAPVLGGEGAALFLMERVE